MEDIYPQGKEEQTTRKDHRRKGSAFDVLAGILRGIKEIIFSQGMIMRNRPSLISDNDAVRASSNNVLEFFVKDKVAGKSDYMFFGRNGKLEEIDGTLVNTVAMSANIDTDNPAKVGNGRLEMSLFKDSALTAPQFVIDDGRIYGLPSGSSVMLLSETGSGVIQIGVFNSSNVMVSGITISSAGVEITNQI